MPTFTPGSTELLFVSEKQVAALRTLDGLVVEIAQYDRGRTSDVVMVESRLQQAETTLQSRQIAQTEARARIREIAAMPVDLLGVAEEPPTLEEAYLRLVHQDQARTLAGVR